jgi:predicted transcriptional regulator
MGADAMTTSSPTATVLKTELTTIEGIQRGLADVKAGRTVSHEDAMASVRKIIDVAANNIV